MEIIFTNRQQLRPPAELFEGITGIRPHPSTCWRYSARGIRGIKLRTWRVGGRRLTTEAAVLQFVDELSAASESGLKASQVRKELDRELGIDR